MWIIWLQTVLTSLNLLVVLMRFPKPKQQREYVARSAESYNKRVAEFRERFCDNQHSLHFCRPGVYILLAIVFLSKAFVVEVRMYISIRKIRNKENKLRSSLKEFYYISEI